MDERPDTLKKKARLAGLFYLLMALIAPFSVMYVPSKIMVKGDAGATARNLLDHEFLFRVSIAGDLLSYVLFILVILLLYGLFEEIHRHQARLMAALVLAGIPVVFVLSVLNITALMVLKPMGLRAFESDQVYDLAGILLKAGRYGGQMVQLFWGLWLIPFGQLVIKSGFIPRIMGFFLILNGIAYVILCFNFILFPDYQSLVFRISLPCLFLGEVPVIFWLLIKGVKVQQSLGAKMI